MPGAHVASKSLKDGESFYQINSEFGGVGRRSTFRHIDCFADPSRRVSKGFVCRIVSFCSKTKRSKKMIIYGSIWPYTDTYPYRSQHFFNLMLKKTISKCQHMGAYMASFFARPIALEMLQNSTICRYLNVCRAHGSKKNTLGLTECSEGNHFRGVRFWLQIKGPEPFSGHLEKWANLRTKASRSRF